MLREASVEELNTTGIDYILIKNGKVYGKRVEASKLRYTENALRLEYDRVHKDDSTYSKLGRRADYASSK